MHPGVSSLGRSTRRPASGEVLERDRFAVLIGQGEGGGLVAGGELSHGGLPFAGGRVPPASGAPSCAGDHDGTNPLPRERPDRGRLDDDCARRDCSHDRIDERARSGPPPIVIRATEPPAHNRRKVYVHGAGGVRVPYTEVALSDSPGSGGPTANPPVLLYDTSGPGSVPTVGTAPLRLPWIEGAGMSWHTRVGRSTGATMGAPRSAGPSARPRPSPVRPPDVAGDGRTGHPAPLRPQGRGDAGDELRGRQGGRARRAGA